MKASAGGRSDVVKSLISAGASLDKKDDVSISLFFIYNSIGEVIEEQL